MAERRRNQQIVARSDLTPLSDSHYDNLGTPIRPRRSRRKRSSRKVISLGLWSSRALLLAVAAIYSTNFASVKYLETMCSDPPCNHDPSEASFCRFLVSAFVCIPILYANRQNLQIIKAGLECGFWMSVNYVCQAEALEYIPAGKCAFIAALAVAIVPIFAGFFLGKPIKPISLFSSVIALLGVAILENLFQVGATAPINSGIFSSLGKGDILALGQPLGFGYGVMRIEHYIEKYSHVPNRVLTLTASQCVAVCVLSFLWVLYDSDGQVPDLAYMMETHRLIALGWTGIVTTVLAIILQGIALQKASATDASLIFSTEPVWGSLFAGWLLNESLSRTTYIGGSLILAACVLGSFADNGANESRSQLPTERRRQRYKSKLSNLSTDSLLPTLHDETLTDSSVPSLTDIQQFPTNVSRPGANKAKMSAFI